MRQEPKTSIGRFFLPGPSEVAPEVLAAQTHPMIGHRGSAIHDLIAEIEVGLKQVFLTERPVILSTSSATGLMEAAIRNGVGQGRVLSLVNGAFSKRFADIAASCGRIVDVWEVPWGGFHTPEELADRLSSDAYEAVTVTHSETSTGVMQDLEALARVVARNDRALLLVDSVTGVCGTEVRTDDWLLDWVFTGSQKAMALPPGMAFGVASEAMLERSATLPGKGVYFDLVALTHSLEVLQTPATPAISLMYALRFQLERILAEGLETRWKRHEAMRDRTMGWIGEMSGVGVAPFAPEGHRSPTVTCITLPERLAGPEVVAGMRERNWVIGSGYGKLKETTIRIGHMGDRTVGELDYLLDDLADVIG
ncbi:MAG TPA: alanine--glyoxylate aminotransferase family protein [Acidimicrobiia bacterium]|nr:alanine--glyoxylate aminotransferase family protein [Acidimicrobiia bacterium]